MVVFEVEKEFSDVLEQKLCFLYLKHVLQKDSSFCG